MEHSVLFAVSALLLLIGQLEQSSTDPAAVAAIVTELRASVEAIRRDPVHKLGLPLELELERIVSVRTAAILRNVSVDSIIRHFAPFIVRTGNKVRGIKLKHVLDLAGDTLQLPPPRRKKVALVPARKRRLGQGSRAQALVTARNDEAPEQGPGASIPTSKSSNRPARAEAGSQKRGTHDA